jgi:hypothetical protein
MTKPFSPVAQAVLSMTTSLSPDAKTVLNAVTLATEGSFIDPYDLPVEAHKIAVALRAAADQVAPQGGVFLMTASEDRIRHQLLAIATELGALSND